MFVINPESPEFQVIELGFAFSRGIWKIWETQLYIRNHSEIPPEYLLASD